MADPTKRDGEGGGSPDSSDDAALSARLKQLDARLHERTALRGAQHEPRTRSTSDPGAIGRAFRLSAEFVSGVIAGGILGWIVDRLFGIAPWGLIVCLILGFCAGMLNLMRAAGMVTSARSDDTKR